MAGGLRWLAAGLLIGVAATFLVLSLTGGGADLPERIAEKLGCSDATDGVHPSTAAAHHASDGSHGFSWFASTHAVRILSVNGCEPVGPATGYLEFSDQMNMNHVLGSLDNFGAVCLVDHSVFEGKLLNGRTQLEELCEAVGGDLRAPR